MGLYYYIRIDEAGNETMHISTNKTILEKHRNSAKKRYRGLRLFKIQKYELDVLNVNK